MATCIEMEPFFNLGSIPPDIKRMILEKELDSACQIRLISPSWNTMFNECIGGRKLPCPLERVYLSAGVPTDDCNRIKVYKKDELVRNDPVHMYAIFPERYSDRVGVGGWLNIHGRSTDGAVEVHWTPKKITSNGSRAQYRGVCCGIGVLTLCPSPCILFHYGLIFTIPYVLAIIGLFAAIIYAGRNIGQKRKRARAKLGRFFSTFTNIETLVLENFGSVSQEMHMSWAAEKALRGVRINKLEIREYHLNGILRDRIICLCRFNKVKHLFISAHVMDLDLFTKFVVDLISLGVSVDIYELNGMADIYYFYWNKAYWDQKASNLVSDRIILRMNTMHDDSFDRTAYGPGVKSHIRCEKLDSGQPLLNGQQLVPVVKGRGFNHRWI